MSEKISVLKSLEYLADTDETCAQAKASMKYYEHHLKTVKALDFLDATGTQKDRESQAYAGNNYDKCKQAYRDAVFEYEKYNNKRKTAELTIEVWRSQNANRRNGNI